MSYRNLPTGYFFTFVIYPEFTQEKLLYELGYVFISPIHNKSGLTGKPHKHVLLKTPNKYTANTFYEKFVYLLNGDFTGIAIFTGELLVNDVSQMLRYFYHLDNPNKERFDYDNSYLNCDICFSPYVAKAFDLEISNILTIMLLGSGICTLDFVFKKASINTFVLQYWLRQGRNLYYISKLLDENLKNNCWHIKNNII